MSTATSDERIERIERFIDEAINGDDYAAVDDLFADDYEQSFARSAPMLGPEPVKRYLDRLHVAFPDIETTIEEFLTGDDAIAVRYTTRGTHDGELSVTTPDGDVFTVDPTGKEIEIGGLSLYHFEDGKVARGYGLIEELKLLRELDISL